ncbi:MAG: PepSY domain-containing protein [Alistipes sp.]|nr:PepSY domain-containing protein [Alistipes sp.]
MRKFFKQIHIWLSIPFGLVISITCFTGAMLIFEPEITAWVQSDYQRVERVGVAPLPIDELLSRVEPTLKEGQRITGVTIFEDAELCYKVGLSEPKHAATYVDQYSGEVKGEPGRLDFFRTMFRLHRWLMDERPEDDTKIFWGKMIVGVSTLMFIVIVLSGIVIWVPKSIKALKHRTKISLRKGWHRFWYDLHVVGGIYATLLLLAMALTGLTWSFEWYRNDFYKLFGVELEAPKSNNRVGDASGRARDERREANSYLSWERAYANTLALAGNAERMTISRGSVSVPCEGWGNQRASDKYLFDEATGEITSKELYADSDRSRKVRGWIYSVHVGNWGGMLTRILWFLAAMLGAALPLTGYYLWIRRLTR